MRRTLLATWGLLLAAILLLAACGDSGADATEIRMLDNSFAPFVLEVDPGEPIAFANAGRVEHNAIAVDDVFNTLEEAGANQQPGESFTVTLSEPGVYDFFCSLHATQNDSGDWEGMVGTLIVGDVATAAEVVAAESTAPEAWTGATRSVPDSYQTIQSAVDAADPGDLVLIEPGVYKEAVAVTTPGLTIRGTDRNAVILDGELTRDNGIVVTADGVAIENMTARGYTVNGFFWSGVTGYRGSYLTAIDDFVYGIYAFDSVDGLFEHSYASGSWDAGFYVGQCDPCNAVVTDVLAEFNGLGYSGTNSSGNIWIVNSEWRNNVGGIVPNTLDSELLPPANNVVVAGNYIHDNGDGERAPSGDFEWAAYGSGVMLAGVRDSVVRNNLIVNNRAGVQVISMIDANVWPSGANEVRDNVIMGSGRADLLLGGPLEQGSCFEGNEAKTTVPYLLRLLHRCDGVNIPLWYGLATSSEPLGRLIQAERGQKPDLQHGEAPKPELTFAQLPAGADAPVVPAVNVFASIEFEPAAITTPSLPPGVEIDSRQPVAFGVALDGGFWPVFVGALVWWVPLLTWLIGGAWALSRIWRRGGSLAAKFAWSLVVVAVPVFGVLAYLAFGTDTVKRWRRIAAVVGGALGWVAAVAAAFVIGGLI